MSPFGFIKNRVAQYNQLAIQWRWNPRLIMWSAMTSTRHLRPRLIMAENCLGKWMVALCDHLPEGRKEHIEKGVFWTLWFWQCKNFATSKLFVKNKATGTPLDRCMHITPRWRCTATIVPCCQRVWLYIILSWGYLRCSFRRTGQCEGL